MRRHDSEVEIANDVGNVQHRSALVAATAQAPDYLSLRSVQLEGHAKWVIGTGELHLFFPTRGAGEFVGRGVTQRFAAGDVLVVSGASGGVMSPRPKGDLALSAFSVSAEQLSPLFASQEIALLQQMLRGLKRPRHYPAGGAVAFECSRLLGEVPAELTLAHRSQLLRVAAVVLSEEFRNLGAERSGYIGIDEHLAQVLGKLSAEEILSLSVGELAERFGCSRRHLNRLFQEYFGVSAIGLRMEMRLLRALALLRDPRTKVIHVAEQSGFNHLGLFNTCFKRRFGLSPAEWRRQTPCPANPLTKLLEGDPSCRMRATGLCPWGGKGPASCRPDVAT